MSILIVFESMYGNTHDIADHVASGLGERHAVDVVAASTPPPQDLEVELLVVGGPTHVHGLSRASTRTAAADAAATDKDLHLDDSADNESGLREWLAALGEHPHARAAAFDTRLDAAAVLTGRASRRIAKHLRGHGYDLIAEPESFLVDKHNHLLPGEAERARHWGAQLADQLPAAGTEAAGSDRRRPRD